MNEKEKKEKEGSEITNKGGGQSNNKKKKEKWVKPQLIVLVRGKPEESVLNACKVALEGGPIIDHYECNMGGLNCAGPCSSEVGS